MGISGISIYSFIIAIICFNFFLLLIAILRRNTMFLVKNSTSILLLLSLLGVIRLIAPLDMSNAVIIQSNKIVPAIQSILGKQVLGVITCGGLLIFIWSLGTTITLLKVFTSLYLETKKFNKYSKIQDMQVTRIVRELSLKNSIVIVSPEVDVPKVFGFFKAHIYLPPISVSDDELKIILRHEYQHFNGHDSFIKVFYLILSAFFWWNPVVHIFQHEVDNLLELRCDSAITKNMNNDERRAYLKTILLVIKQTTLKNKFALNTATFVKRDDKEFIQQRFKIVLHEQNHKAPKIQIATLATIILVFITSYFVIIQPTYYPPQSELEGQVNIAVDNAYILVSSDGTMHLIVSDILYSTVTPDELNVEPFSQLKIIRKGEE